MGIKDFNCWKYFLSKAPYDVLVTIMKNTGICPVAALTGEFDINVCFLHHPHRIFKTLEEEAVCYECLQKWLNKKTQ